MTQRAVQVARFTRHKEYTIMADKAGRITTTERRELRKYIEAEFEDVASHIADMTSEAVDAAYRRIDEDFASKEEQVANYEDQVDDLLNQADSDLQKLLAKAEKSGVVVERYTSGRLVNRTKNDLTLKVRGKQQAKDAAHLEIRKEQNIALRELGRRRRAVEKNLILDALHTEDAQAFLENIPTAAELLGPKGAIAAVAQERELPSS
jgi:hypothetical protein